MFSPFEKIRNFFNSSKKLNVKTWEQFEELLYETDLGVRVVEKLSLQMKEKLSQRHEFTLSELEQQFREMLYPTLSKLEKKIEIHADPFIVMIVGVNGVGKTTTVAKIARYFKNQQRDILMVAADTFRAAAVNQLKCWGDRLGIEVFSNEKGEPASVIYDAIGKALKRKNALILIDTAGRMHTRQPLMEELRKMKRVIQKSSASAPQEIWCVIDAHTGQNALNQCREFHEALGLTGVIFTKMDGTAKGGTLISISHEFGIPIVFLGIGEKEDHLIPFSASDFLHLR